MNNRDIDILKKRAEISMSIPGIRKGQALMNTLQELHPDIYTQVTNTKYDPYHNDNMIVSQ